MQNLKIMPAQDSGMKSKLLRLSYGYLLVFSIGRRDRYSLVWYKVGYHVTPENFLLDLSFFAP